jgi:hypothetical protein
MKKFITLGLIITIGLVSSWYLDIWHDAVENIDELIGQNYDYAHKIYFRTEADNSYKININNELNEFDGAILYKMEFLTDSIVQVYTWEFVNHKKTIWIGETDKMKNQVIDAIRYKNNIQF